MRLLWLLAGLLSLSVGIVGIVLPLVPTVPLVLLAAFCFARSSSKLHSWLLEHPKFGPHIDDWNSRGAISRRGKRLASVSIAAVFGVSLALSMPMHIVVIQAATLGAVLTFIWTRPNS